MTHSQDLKGQVAIITGAAKNLGRAFAQMLAGRGADVVIHYHADRSRNDAEEAARLVQEQGVRALIVQADLSQAQQVAVLFDQTMNTFGRLDILINNAGLVIKKAIADYTEDDFDRSFGINAKAPFLTMKHAANLIKDQGRIINIGTSLQGAYTGHYGVYAGSKAPLEGFTRALSKEIGARGVTVNTVAPGALDTAFFHGQENEQSVAYISGASVLGRLGDIDDIVPVVAFLASEEARWVTGQTWFVNGGHVTR